MIYYQNYCMLFYLLAIFAWRYIAGDILLAILFTGDILLGDILLAIYCWRYFAGDISSVHRSHSVTDSAIVLHFCVFNRFICDATGGF